MARISGVDLPREKRIEIGLTYVYGIGKSTAKEILKATGISEDVRVKDLTEEEIAKLEDRNTEIDEELTKEEVYSNSIECQKLSTERAANEARLEELYELWEELAE